MISSQPRSQALLFSICIIRYIISEIPSAFAGEITHLHQSPLPLDEAKVDELARMIKQQGKLAQFIVVSWHPLMIEFSERTITITQTREAYTQVLGRKLSPSQGDVEIKFDYYR